MNWIGHMDQLQPTLIVLRTHHQTHENSCIPMAVEYVLKELGKVDIDFFDFQNDESKHKVDSWIPYLSLGDIRFTLEHNLDNDKIFERIDSELANNRRIMISLEYELNHWHMYIIYGRDTYGKYKVVTSIPNAGICFEELKDLKNLIPKMNGVGLITYKPQI